jgi:hypothetical protein
MKSTLPIVTLIAIAAVAVATLPALGLLAGPAAVSWGHGFAAGGLATLLATLLTLRSAPSSRLGAVVAVAGMQMAGLAAVFAAVRWAGAAVLDGLAGVAAGWFAISLVLHRASQPIASAGTAFVTALCAAAMLGTFRQMAAAVTPQWVIAALALAAVVALVGLAIGFLAASSRRGATAGGPEGAGRDAFFALVASAVVAGAAYVIAFRTLHEPRWLAAAGIGLALPLVLAWLTADNELETAMGALVTLGAGIAAFYALAGYGIGLMLVAAALPAGLLVALGSPGATPGRGQDDRMVQLLLFGAVFVVYRVFVQRFQDDLGAAAVTDHLAIFSVIAGALLPSLLSGVLARTEAAGATLLRVALTLIAAVAGGAALLVLWGARAGLGLLSGLMVGALMPGSGSRGGLLALAAAIPLLQWSHTLLLVAAQTRAEKARVLVWLVGVAIAAVVAADVWGRMTRGGRPHPGGAVTPAAADGAASAGGGGAL